MLDVNLRGEKSVPVAKILRSLDIPFLLSSAYDQATVNTEAALAGAPNLGKPVSPARLLAALALLLQPMTN